MAIGLIALIPDTVFATGWFGGDWFGGGWFDWFGGGWFDWFGGGTGGTNEVPEFTLGAAAGALTLVTGGVTVLFGRRQKKQ